MLRIFWITCDIGSAWSIGDIERETKLFDSRDTKQACHDKSLLVFATTIVAFNIYYSTFFGRYGYAR